VTALDGFIIGATIGIMLGETTIETTMVTADIATTATSIERRGQTDRHREGSTKCAASSLQPS
jgi:hypothetical protein